MNEEKKKHPVKRILRGLIRRRVIILLLILIQLVWIVMTLLRFYNLLWLRLILSAVSVFTSLHLLTRQDKSAFKLSLIFLILLFPFVGGTFYWIFHFQTTSVGFRKRIKTIEKKTRPAFYPDEDVLIQAEERLPDRINHIRYLQEVPGFPVYKNTETIYFPNGKEMLDALLPRLREAKRYIFLEYFIIEEGKIWNAVLDILKEKSRDGVDVRVIYDDLGCFLRLPDDYGERLRANGIQCAVFNRFHPFLTTTQNNRDHRKIAVIDGTVAFTGGINMADEYIGETIKYGKWKDNAVMLSGDGAWSLTVMFLQTWSFLTKKEVDFDSLRPIESSTPDGACGFVQPYCDSPMDRENVGEHVYLHLINRAMKYLYVTTPYLMVDDGLISALCLAAKSGVDVRLITPMIPDKKMVHFTTRSYYKTLVDAGVRVYEYKDGFIHAKSMVSDDSIASVGTVNLDFRSLYLHFECGTCLYDCPAVTALRDDFLETLNHCKPIAPQDCRSGYFKRIFQNICRVFAPLM